MSIRFFSATTLASSENEIANAAGRVLHESFITASQNGSVLYVENDNLVRKTPEGKSVFVKRLAGRNTQITKEFVARGTFKIKKRKFEAVTE